MGVIFEHISVSYTLENTHTSHIITIVPIVPPLFTIMIPSIQPLHHHLALNATQNPHPRLIHHPINIEPTLTITSVTTIPTFRKKKKKTNFMQPLFKLFSIFMVMLNINAHTPKAITHTLKAPKQWSFLELVFTIVLLGCHDS